MAGTKVTSDRLRYLLTNRPEGKTPDQVIAALRARNYIVEPDTVKKVREHFRTVRAEQTAVAPTDSASVPPAPTEQSDAAAKAVAAAAPIQEPDPTPAQVGQSILHAAGQALPPTLALAGSMALPEIPAVKGALAAAGPAGRAVARVLGAKEGKLLGKVASGGAKAVVGLGGAGLGGSIGEMASELMQGSHQIDTDRIVREGEKQAILHGVGTVAGKAVGGTGKILVAGALRATPEVAQTAIREGVRVGQKGLDKVMARLGVGGDQITKIAEDAARRGFRYNPADLAREAWEEVAPTIPNNPEGDAAERMLMKKTKDFLDQHTSLPSVARSPTYSLGTRDNQLFLQPDPLGKIRGDNAGFKVTPGGLTEKTPVDLLDMKRQADDIAKPIYERMKRKEVISARTLVRYRWAKALSDASRRRLNAIDFDPVTMRSPMMAANEYEGQLIDLKNAIRDQAGKSTFFQRFSERTAPGLLGAAIGGAVTPGGLRPRAIGAVVGMGAGAALGAPSLVSGTGLALNNPYLLKLIQASPQLAQLASINWGQQQEPQP